MSRAVIALAFAACIATDLAGCECMIRGDIKGEFKSADAVFVGEVLAYDGSVARVRVLERFKGDVGPAAELLTRQSAASCGYGDRLGIATRHLFYVEDHSVSSCSRTRSIDEAACDLRYLRRRAAWWRFPLSSIRILHWLGFYRSPCVTAP